MYLYKAFIRFFSILFLYLSLLNATTVYEDAEDTKTSRWSVVFSPTLAEVKNYYDDKKVSRVIHFKGEGTKTIFQLNSKKDKEKSLKREFWLSWEMKFNEDVVIIVVLQTTRGEEYLIYTQGFNESYKQLGLGDNVCNGEWQRFERNLQEDLNYFDNRSTILGLKSFVIKGSGSVDNIQTQIKNISEKKIVTQKNPQKKIKILKQSIVKNNKKNTLPTIKIEGDNPLHLAIGEPYVELGVSAYDKEDGELTVTSNENINVNQDGSYMVMYMAQDSHGDMALDKRIVNVGKGELVEEEMNKKSDSNEEELEENTTKIAKEDSKQLWQRKLELRVQELKEKLYEEN